MKILFLQLTDIHIEKSDDIKVVNTQKIADALSCAGEFQSVVIFISGDIAYSGERPQYESAWEFLGTIKSTIRNKYHINPQIYIVPGNHDVNYGGKSISHQDLQELKKNKKYDQAIHSELRKQWHYTNFARGNHCYYQGNPLLFRKELDFDGFKIEVNLLNSAIFSSLDEDKGLHYMPESVINEIQEPTEADLAITVMHHSHHWFCNSESMEKALFQKNSIIFYGHEHVPDEQDIKTKGTKVKIVRGGELSNKGNWDQSAFNVAVFDTENYTFSKIVFNWNMKEKVYMPLRDEDEVIDKKPSRRIAFPLRESFCREFYIDGKNNVSKDISDYFVFPHLEEEAIASRTIQKVISNKQDFISEILKVKKIEIVGRENSGKTTLLKQIFKELQTQKVVLYCDMSDVNVSNVRRFLRGLFEDTYSENDADFVKFWQMNASDKVLIMDNADAIDRMSLLSLRTELDKQFQYVICSSKNVIDLNIAERIKREIHELEKCKRYRIQQFFTDKRQQLVTNIVRIRIVEDPDRQDLIIRILLDSLTKQRRLYNLDPDFIVRFSLYYCANVQEASSNDGSVFSKVFEASLTASLVPFINKRLTIEKVLIILDKIAYHAHSNREYPIKQETIGNIIEWYNGKFGGMAVNLCEFLQIITNAKVMICTEDPSLYVFCNKNYQAYFTAREIRRKCQDEHDLADLERILNYACFGINADILLFLTYITDNMSILRMILKTAVDFTKDWPEFNLDDININYLANLNPMEISAPKEEDKRIEEMREVEKERTEVSVESIQSLQLYNYDEKNIDITFNQIIRAISLLNVIARSLPSFEHSMFHEDKKAFVDAIYRLPNKIFYMWAIEVDAMKLTVMDEIRDAIKEQVFTYKYEDLKEDDLLAYLQLESVSVLLELLNISASDSARENTDTYLEEFDYSSTTTYSLLHLLILSVRAKEEHFIREAARIYDGNKSVTSQLMTRRVVHNFMIKSPKLNQKHLQQMSAKYFNSPGVYRSILIERTRNANINQ